MNIYVESAYFKISLVLICSEVRFQLPMNVKEVNDETYIRSISQVSDNGVVSESNTPIVYIVDFDWSHLSN